MTKHKIIQSLLLLRSFEGPVILAYSGGVDSHALLTAWTQCAHALPPLIVAHADHGLRQSSGDEAKLLEKHVTKLGFSWVCERLNIPKGSNLEERARKERYAFFKRVYTAYNAKALILAHQADEWAETILKRCLEGAAPSKLYGMKKKSTIDGMLVLRPLLEIQKKDLAAFASPLVDDESNRDCHFLRAKMRKELMPFLSDTFGKNIVGGLCKLGAKSAKLEEKMTKTTSTI